MQAVQLQIAEQLKVQPPFADENALQAEVARRIVFIQDCLTNARLKTLVANQALDMEILKEAAQGNW